MGFSWFRKLPRWSIIGEFGIAKQRDLSSISKDFLKDGKVFSSLKHWFTKKLGCNFLKPYLLQTVLLHECAKFSDVDQWTEEELPSRFHGLVEVLESFARDKNCPHFFIPSLNLFTEISNEDLKGLCKKIKFIRERCGKVKGQESFLEKD